MSFCSFFLFWGAGWAGGLKQIVAEVLDVGGQFLPAVPGNLLHQLNLSQDGPSTLRTPNLPFGRLPKSPMRVFSPRAGKEAGFGFLELTLRAYRDSGLDTLAGGLCKIFGKGIAQTSPFPPALTANTSEMSQNKAAFSKRAEALSKQACHEALNEINCSSTLRALGFRVQGLGFRV